MYEGKEWIDLPKEVKKDTIKYLKLIKRFNNNPKLIPTNHKKWILVNSDLPSYLIPNELLDEENLWLI